MAEILEWSSELIQVVLSLYAPYTIYTSLEALFLYLVRKYNSLYKIGHV